MTERKARGCYKKDDSKLITEMKRIYNEEYLEFTTNKLTKRLHVASDKISRYYMKIRKEETRNETGYTKNGSRGIITDSER